VNPTQTAKFRFGPVRQETGSKHVRQGDLLEAINVRQTAKAGVYAKRKAFARTAQTLNSGIRLVGSRAAMVNRLAAWSPPQWKGAKMVSSRMPVLTSTAKVTLPRRLSTTRDLPGRTPSRVAKRGWIWARGSGRASTRSLTLRVCAPEL